MRGKSMYDVKKEDFKLDEDLETRAAWAMRRTWDYIGDDYLSMCENGECSRGEMLEAVMDADRLAVIGGDLEAAQYAVWLERFESKHWKEFLKRHFPYERYSY